MPHEPFKDVGLGEFAFVLLILKIVFDFVAGMRKKSTVPVPVGNTAEWNDLLRQTKDLWDWHNVGDEEGVKIWYVRKSIEESLKKSTETQALIAKMLERIDNREERMLEILDIIEKRLRTG